MAANPTYIDGVYTTPLPCSLPEFSAPFEGQNTDYVLTQDWYCALDSFAPTALDTAHPDYSDFKMALESNKRDLGNGVVQWTRTYCKLPAEYNEAKGSIIYTFPGWWGTFAFSTGTETITGRTAQTRLVPAIMVRKFYNTDNPAADIPILPAQGYWYDPPEDLLPVSYLFAAGTTPTLAQYKDLIAADTFNLVTEQSTISRWLGNFWVRETIYVKAQ